MISSSMLILFYTIQQVIPNICTKFQNPRHPEKSLTQISLCIALEREMKKGKMEREGKNKSQHLGFLSHNILGHSQGV